MPKRPDSDFVYRGGKRGSKREETRPEESSSSTREQSNPDLDMMKEQRRENRAGGQQGQAPQPAVEGSMMANPREDYSNIDPRLRPGYGESMMGDNVTEPPFSRGPVSGGYSSGDQQLFQSQQQAASSGDAFGSQNQGASEVKPRKTRGKAKKEQSSIPGVKTKEKDANAARVAAGRRGEKALKAFENTQAYKDYLAYKKAGDENRTSNKEGKEKKQASNNARNTFVSDRNKYVNKYVNNANIRIHKANERGDVPLATYSMINSHTKDKDALKLLNDIRVDILGRRSELTPVQFRERVPASAQKSNPRELTDSDDDMGWSDQPLQPAEDPMQGFLPEQQGEYPLPPRNLLPGQYQDYLGEQQWGYEQPPQGGYANYDQYGVQPIMLPQPGGYPLPPQWENTPPEDPGRQG